MDTQNPGLVEDGTRCGDGLVCLSQQCVSVSQIAKMSCEPAPNGLVCSGNGVRVFLCMSALQLSRLQHITDSYFYV